MNKNQYDLNLEIESIKLELEAGQNSTDRQTKLLVKEEDYRLVLIRLKKGAHIKEHSAAGRIFVQVLEGHIQMNVLSSKFDMPQKNLLTIEPNIKHDVLAIEESVFLLTLSL